MTSELAAHVIAGLKIDLVDALVRPILLREKLNKPGHQAVFVFEDKEHHDECPEPDKESIRRRFWGGNRQGEGRLVQFRQFGFVLSG